VRKELERARRSRLVFTAFLAVAILISGLLLLTVFLHVGVAQNEERLREASKEIELERRRQDALRTEIAALESPGRVEKEAVNRLGMVRVDRAEYLQTPAYRAALERKLREREEALPEAQARAEGREEGGI
jgi:cell division protein FtsB